MGLASPVIKQRVKIGYIEHARSSLQCRRLKPVRPGWQSGTRDVAAGS
jgi:hypothetical protein